MAGGVDGAVPLLDAGSAKAGDEQAVAAGDTWAGLMHRAAHALAAGVLECTGFGYGLRVVVVVGSGNNGGDGWAAAPILAARGAHVTVVTLAPLDAELSDEAAGFRSAWVGRGSRTIVGVDHLDEVVATADVVVDCMLGTGATGAPRGDVATAVAHVEAADAMVVSCDIPTGVDADTGVVHDPAVRADLTVTFGARKRGLLLAPGCWQAGRVVVGDLGPRYRAPTTWHALTARGAAPDRWPPDADKRAHGVVLVVAGSVGSGGAAIMATRAALSAGAGLVTLATPAHIQRVIVPAVPAAMTRPLRHSGSHVALDAVDQLLDVADFDVAAAGPGMGPVEGTRAVAEHLLESARRVILDADAINVFRDDPARLASHLGDLVLTPHERELARMGGGRNGPDAWANRVERVPALAAEYDATIVAKGPRTIVAAPDGRVWVTPLGGPELGTGGTGDVLTGMLAPAVATADDVPAAVAAAVWRHAFAAHHLASRRGIARLGADELAAAIMDADGTLAQLAAVDPAWPFDG